MIFDHEHKGWKWSTNNDGARDCDACHRLYSRDIKRYRLAKLTGAQLDTYVTDKTQITSLRHRVKVVKRKKGVSYHQIARGAGVNRTTFQRLMKPGEIPERIRLSTATKVTRQLNRLMKDDADARRLAKYKGRVNKELSILAIRGLQLRGYPLTWIAEKAGVSRSYIGTLMDPKMRAVSVELDAKLTELAREYGTTDGPSNRTRVRAQNLGYESTVMRDEFL